MSGRGRPPHKFVRRELTALDKWPKATMQEIAKEVGCSKATVHNWLVMLGSIRQWPSLDAPVVDLNGPKCARCEILLAEAPRGVGGECGWCQQEVDYIERLKEDAERVPGYVIDIGALMLVEVEA